MAKKRRRLRYFKNLVDFPKWMGYSDLKKTGADLVDSVKDFRSEGKVEREESFEEAIKRMGLKEEDVQNRLQQTYRASLIYAFIGLLLFCYGIYLLITVVIIGWALAWLLATVMFAFAYRESFWHFQMTVRKLGCTPKEYMNYMLGRASK